MTVSTLSGQQAACEAGAIPISQMGKPAIQRNLPEYTRTLRWGWDLNPGPADTRPLYFYFSHHAASFLVL